MSYDAFLEQQRRLAALLDRLGGYRMPAGASRVAQALETSRLLAKLNDLPTAVIASQQAQLAKTTALMNQFELRSAGAILLRQHEEMQRVLASINSLPMTQIANSVQLRELAALEVSQRIAAFIQSTNYTRLGESLTLLSSRAFGLDRFANTFFDYLRRLPTAEWFAAHELARRGWWLVPSWGIQLVEKLLSERQERRCSMGAVLTAHYRRQKCRELGRMVRRWDLREFKVGGRPALFEDALRQYRDGQYRAVILSLEPQLEGILKDFLMAEGLCTSADFKRTTTPQLFEKHVSASRPFIRGFALQLEHMYAKFEWEDPAPRRRVRRHAHAHGREVPRNSEQDALRLWLLLETLHYHLGHVRHRRKQGAA